VVDDVVYYEVGSALLQRKTIFMKIREKEVLC